MQRHEMNLALVLLEGADWTDMCVGGATTLNENVGGVTTLD